MLTYERKYLIAEPLVAWGSFIILLTTYWLTVAPTVSFWDCPEYVSAAYLLEVGHPPGNPTWMLVERIVTLLFPARYAALAVNLSSGLFTAFAGFFLAKTIFRAGLWVLLKLPRRGIPAPLAAAGAALVGTLIFGWCDSVWYSAVEAEVYAMSIFMTSLCIWLMTKWAGTSVRGDSWRLLVLIAYIFGLSIGIHQLNLLCIPALAMIWAVRRGIRSPGRLLLIFLLSLTAVACILVGMMPSTIAIASKIELIAVNVFNLPFLTGVAAYVGMLALSLLIALFTISRSNNRVWMAAACFPAIALSGIFIFSEHYIAGVIISAVVAVLLVSGSNFTARRLYLSIWMLAMLLTGYSSYAIIPIRGSVPSQANSGMPGDPFSFASYQNREQYGSSPLLYGPTPYSKPLLKEHKDPDGGFTYAFYEINYKNPIYVPKKESEILRSDIPGLSTEDSLENSRLMSREGDAYIIKGIHSDYVRTPELNMWFPRITGSDPYDLMAYEDWLGMDSSSMVSVDISEAVDSAGNFVAKTGKDGKRGHLKGLRPTYIQNLRWFLIYQSSYMYWRYLMWNFVGRQNDRPAQGEVQHGNFITGFNAVDNAMLGAEDKLPPVAGSENKGRNRYFGIPLLLGLLGIGWLLISRKRGMEACFIIAILFVMTGIAITVYLNQGPGEPRERDYSFLGSYLAFCIWIAFGSVAIARFCRSMFGFVVPLAVAGWMCYENYDDHDRSGQFAAREFGAAMLNSVEKDAIIFVNGDNYTFPLWYAQEVEGIRRDVRIVNVAYLSTPVYTSNLLADWRDSKALRTILGRSDIIWDKYRATEVPLLSGDTLTAAEALARLRQSDNPQFPVRYVTIPVGSDSTMIFDLRELSAGKRTVPFGKLMMFDITVSATDSENPRPVYWIGAMGADKRAGLTRFTSPWMFGRRFGMLSNEHVDSLMAEGANAMKAPNRLGKDVYMDHAPATMTGAMRGALVIASRRMLEAGKIAEAVNLAAKADIEMGEGPDTYGSIRVEDTVFNVRRELGKLLLECADSLHSEANAMVSHKEGKYWRALYFEMKIRGKYHLNQAEERKKAWIRYREALPPRLRDKMSPVY